MEANREDAGTYMDGNNISTTPINDAEAENNNELNFNQFWLNQLTSADSWDNFEATLHNFTVATLEKAKKHTHDDSNNSNRPRPQARPNNVPPRAINRRPQNYFHARAASRIQGLYKMARKRAFHHITKENDVKYDGGKGRAEAFFTDIQGRTSTSINLKTFYNNMFPKLTTTTSLTTLLTSKEVTNRLNKMSNTSPGPDKLEYKHMKTIDNTGRILTYIFNKCREMQKIPKLWKTALLY